jgi:hypothetical protein
VAPSGPTNGTQAYYATLASMPGVPGTATQQHAKASDAHASEVLVLVARTALHMHHRRPLRFPDRDCVRRCCSMDTLSLSMVIVADVVLGAA